MTFQHTAARRRLGHDFFFGQFMCVVSTHSRPKAAGSRAWFGLYSPLVSTHSRPKAAGPFLPTYHKRASCFNTQPPEGGWRVRTFQFVQPVFVSTHSRPKAAGDIGEKENVLREVSTHSRPKAAGASLKSLAPSGFAAPISLSSQEKREREYNTAFSVTPVFAIS